MLCQKCGLTEAVVHRESKVFRQIIEEHLCIVCAGGIDNPAVLKSLIADARDRGLEQLPLPWKPAGEFVGDEQAIRYDPEGLAVLRLVIAQLVQPSPRERSLSVRFADAWISLMPCVHQEQPCIRLMFSWVVPDLDRELSRRADGFFGSHGGKAFCLWEGVNVAWTCDLPRDAGVIAEACDALLGTVASLLPGAAVKVRLDEYFPGTSG